MRGLFVGFALLAACGGPEDRPAAPSTPGGGRSGYTPGGTSAGAGEGSLEAGAGNEGGSASSGAGGDFTSDVDPLPEAAPGLCDPSASFGAELEQAVGQLTDVTLLSMTADEKSIAFASGTGNATALFVADRTENTEAFVETSVVLPPSYEASSGVSLSADGRHLIVVRTDHSGYGELSRNARGEAFGAEVDETRFARINRLKAMTGQSVGWPVLSHDGQQLYQVRYFGNSVVVQSPLGDDGVFELGEEIDSFTLGGDAPGQYKLITGLAADERAIFYYDEATGHSAARFRSRPNSPFYDPADLGARRGVAPSQDCLTLYSSVETRLVSQARE